jgi:hypothetical protein
MPGALRATRTGSSRVTRVALAPAWRIAIVSPGVRRRRVPGDCPLSVGSLIAAIVSGGRDPG